MEPLQNKDILHMLSFLPEKEQQRLMMTYLPWNKLISKLDLDTTNYHKINSVVILPEDFPNVQELKVEDDSRRAMDSVNAKNAGRWNGVTVFLDYTCYGLSKAIMEHGGFSHLTKLKVNFSPNTPAGLLIKQLSKAPSLTRLELLHTTLSDFELDELHRNTAQLKTLSLQDIQLTYNKSQKIENPSSARELTSLVLVDIDYTETLRDNCDRLWDFWVGFMGEKYEGLEEILIEGTITAMGGFNALVTRCPRLVRYTSTEIPITADIFKKMDKTQLKKITFGGLVQKQVEDLLASDQKLHLEEMVMRDTFPEQAFYKKLEGFKNLTYFEISKGASCPINVILQNLTALKSLKLGVRRLLLEPGVPDNFCHKNLKTFTYCSEAIFDKKDSVAVNFLSKSCPELSNLTIECEIDDNKFVLIQFPDHHFTSITLRIGTLTVFKMKKQTVSTWFNFDVSMNMKSSQDECFKGEKAQFAIACKGCDNLKFKSFKP